MKIVILVEGETELAFKQILRKFLTRSLAGNMPKLHFRSQFGGLPTHDKLKRLVHRELDDRKSPADAVIALTDVYTGSQPPLFETAEIAKQKLNQWVGNDPRFYPHVALHDFEAWLLPYWEKIRQLAKSDRQVPGNDPERVNHSNPPAYRIKEIFRIGKCGQHYSKVRDTPRILRGEDLMIAINACPELKAFVNRIVSLAGGQSIP